MSFVPVQCPDCRRAFCINGRGRCRCGAYLIHHAAAAFTIRPGRRTWLWRDRRWTLHRSTTEAAS